MTDINAHSKNMDKTNKVNIYMNIKIKTYHQAHVVPETVTVFISIINQKKTMA